MEALWSSADISVTCKLLIHNAQLNESHTNEMDIFQWKGYRQNLGLETAYVERNNSNAYVHSEVNRIIAKENRNAKEVTKLSEYYKDMKTKRLIKPLKASDNDVAQEITMDSNMLTYCVPTEYRVGQTRVNWLKQP